MKCSFVKKIASIFFGAVQGGGGCNSLESGLLGGWGSVVASQAAPMLTKAIVPGKDLPVAFVLLFNVKNLVGDERKDS